MGIIEAILGIIGGSPGVDFWYYRGSHWSGTRHTWFGSGSDYICPGDCRLGIAHPPRTHPDPAGDHLLAPPY